MCTYSSFTLLDSRNQHNIVKRLHSNLKTNVEPSSECSETLSDFPDAGFERWVVGTECSPSN